MDQLPANRARRWRFRPQFSLRSVLVLMTLCAVGTWYWYQRPFAVEKKYAAAEFVTFLRRPASSSYPSVRGGREIEYVRRVWGGKTVRHGTRRVFDSADKLAAVENYRNGQADGEFAEYYPTGDVKRRDIYVQGRLHGPSREWEQNGNLRFEGAYEHGKRNGRFIYRDADGELSIEAPFRNDTPSGKWTWHSIDALTRQGGKNTRNPHTIWGTWIDGVPDGLWEWRNVRGELYLSANFTRGSAQIPFGPPNLGPRVLEGLIELSIDRPEVLLRAFDHSSFNLRERPLKDVVLGQSGLMRVPIMMNLRVLDAAGIFTDSLVTYEAQETALLVALCEMLAVRNLGCDWRYGVLYIDRADSIAEWRDRTGVLELAPPSDSALERELDRQTNIDMVEMPLGDVMMYVSQLHRVRIDTSLLAAKGGGPTLTTPVTITLRGITFRNGLGAILDQVGCKASVQGETIVIEPQ